MNIKISMNMYVCTLVLCIIREQSVTVCVQLLYMSIVCFILSISASSWKDQLYFVHLLFFWLCILKFWPWKLIVACIGCSISLWILFVHKPIQKWKYFSKSAKMKPEMKYLPFGFPCRHRESSFWAHAGWLQMSTCELHSHFYNNSTCSPGVV